MPDKKINGAFSTSQCRDIRLHHGQQDENPEDFSLCEQWRLQAKGLGCFIVSGEIQDYGYVDKCWILWKVQKHGQLLDCGRWGWRPCSIEIWTRLKCIYSSLKQWYI